MSPILVGALSFPVLFGLIFLRMPIGLAMLICGLGGTALLSGDANIVLAKLKSETYSTFSSYSLSIVPLFLLMGQFATLGGISSSLFRAAESCLGHRKGGVAMATIGACAGFGSICGSSLATAAAMGRIALPELKRCGYSGGLAGATVAAGGTLGILIPPSVVLVIYAILAEQNIAKLFLCAFIPGLLAAGGYMGVVAICARLWPEAAGHPLQPEPWKTRAKALLNVWPVLSIFLLVVGGIYLGWFTPTEAAAIGAAGTALLAWKAGGLSRENMIASILATATATAMIFMIVLGASFFNSFLALSRLPQTVSEYVAGQGLSPWMVLAVILFLYMAFGCIMDSLSMILLTIPIFFPLVSGLDFGLGAEETAIWFGILVLIVVETGLITPPVGLNLFVIQSMDRSVPMQKIWKAVVPFVACDVLRVILLAAFPGITLFLLRAWGAP